MGAGSDHTPRPPSPAPALPISGARTPEEVRAILWHALGAQLPGELLSSLSKRIGKMRLCSDGFAALAQVCLVERERRDMVLAGLDPSVAGALILIEPQTLNSVGEIVDALRIYAPATTCWLYVRGANPALRGVVESDMLAWSAPHTLTPSSTHRSEPQALQSSNPQNTNAQSTSGARLSLSRDTDTLAAAQQPASVVAEAPKAATPLAVPPAPAPSPAPEPSLSRFALTSAELRMLLSTDDDVGPQDAAPADAHRPSARRIVGGSLGPGANP